MPKPIPVERQIQTASEMFIGRLTLLYRNNPDQADAVLRRVVQMMVIASGDPEVRKTYTLDLKIDFDDSNRHKAMMHIFRKKAREVLTAAQLLADHRPPQIGITVGDFFEGGTVEGLMDIGDHPDDDVAEQTGEGQEGDQA